MTNRYQTILSTAVADYCAKHRPGYITGCFSRLFHSFSITPVMQALIDAVNADAVSDDDARTLIVNFLREPSTRKRDLSFASILIDHLIMKDEANRATWEAEVPKASKVVFYAASDPKEFLYRGVDWDPRLAFTKGIACRPIGSVAEALDGGGLMNRAGISTTKEFTVAESYAKNSWLQPTHKGSIYRPHDSSYVLVINPKKLIGIDHDKTTAARTGKSVVSSLQEVKLIENVPANCIKGVWHFKGGGQKVWIGNPNYNPNATVHADEDVTSTPAKLRLVFA